MDALASVCTPSEMQTSSTASNTNLTVAPRKHGNCSDLGIHGLSVGLDKRSKQFGRVPHCHIVDPGNFNQASKKISSARTKNEMGITKK